MNGAFGALPPCRPPRGAGEECPTETVLTETGGCVKYDRPVWQLMYECAAAMPDPFRYEDVARWFAHAYPDIGQATIRAHLVGLCEGGRPKQPQFAGRAPIFRRVSRGMYEVIPEGERKVDPDLPGGVLPGSGPGVDPFAESAFTDATVVEAPAAAEAVDQPVPGDTDEAFVDLIERSGLGGAVIDVPDPTVESADVLLLASDGERVLVPAPAREIYRSEVFQSARLRAENRGTTWFVLSSEHGLLEPGEWVSPDSRSLGDLDPHYRQVWAQWVLARLESLDEPVAGRRVHLVAPDAYVGPLAAVLQDAGAEVTVGDDQRRPGPARPVVEDADPAPPRPARDVEPPRPPAPPHPGAVRAAGGEQPTSSSVSGIPLSRPAAPVDEPVVARASIHQPPPDAAAAQDAGFDEDDVAAVVARLRDAGNAVAPHQLDGIQDVPGLFAWHVDLDGARVLNRSLMLPVGAGVLHVGHAGAVGRHVDAVPSLRQLVQDVQLRGRSRQSTFRATLATVLHDPLGLRSLDDAQVEAWMEDHLTVVTWPVVERTSIVCLAHRVVEALEPPLNVDHLRATEMRRRLGELRREIG